MSAISFGLFQTISRKAGMIVNAFFHTFFLMIISISDDSLDKDERETVLVDLGLYEELLDPNEYGGTTLKNQIQYEIEPIVVENQMVGINFYSRILTE